MYCKGSGLLALELHFTAVLGLHAMNLSSHRHQYNMHFGQSLLMLTKDQGRIVLIFPQSSTGGNAIFQGGSSSPPLMSNFILCCLLQ